MFLAGYLMLALAMGVAGAYAERRLIRWGCVCFAGCLPTILWLVMIIRDAYLFNLPLFDRTSDGARFGFYVGGSLALLATPIWLLVAASGLAIGNSKRKTQ